MVEQALWAGAGRWLLAPSQPMACIVFSLWLLLFRLNGIFFFNSKFNFNFGDKINSQFCFFFFIFTSVHSHFSLLHSELIPVAFTDHFLTTKNNNYFNSHVAILYWGSDSETELVNEKYCSFPSFIVDQTKSLDWRAVHGLFKRWEPNVAAGGYLFFYNKTNLIREKSFTRSLKSFLADK